MSEIQNFYPTSGLADRGFNSIMTAFYNCINGIPEVTDFFDSVEKLGDETKTNYSDFSIELKKGNSILRFLFSGNDGSLAITNNGTTYGSNATDRTEGTKYDDIPVSCVKGASGTNVVWLDSLNKGICMMFNKFGEKYFLANSSMSSSSYSFYYSDTGGKVSNLAKPFNGGNIGKAAEYIAQPYYHYGVNTGDIYTFDGGGANIPWGKFKLGNMEFVRLASNFALRIS